MADGRVLRRLAIGAHGSHEVEEAAQGGAVLVAGREEEQALHGVAVRERRRDGDLVRAPQHHGDAQKTLAAEREAEPAEGVVGVLEDLEEDLVGQTTKQGTGLRSRGLGKLWVCENWISWQIAWLISTGMRLG